MLVNLYYAIKHASFRRDQTKRELLYGLLTLRIFQPWKDEHAFVNLCLRWPALSVWLSDAHVLSVLVVNLAPQPLSLPVRVQTPQRNVFSSADNSVMIGLVKLEIKSGVDLTKENTDAIVNSTNERLDLSIGKDICYGLYIIIKMLYRCGHLCEMWQMWNSITITYVFEYIRRHGINLYTWPSDTFTRHHAFVTATG